MTKQLQEVMDKLLPAINGLSEPGLALRARQLCGGLKILPHGPP